MFNSLSVRGWAGGLDSAVVLWVYGHAEVPFNGQFLIKGHSAVPFREQTSSCGEAELIPVETVEVLDFPEQVLAQQDLSFLADCSDFTFSFVRLSLEVDWAKLKLQINSKANDAVIIFFIVKINLEFICQR
ncbi:MAG: hypothetical protein ABIQ74_12315 [Chitinophagales bacterium]